MQIYPAIDLHRGQCVRLYKGDYAKETVYNSDPFQVANEFIEAGSTWIHIVDLSGAKDPSENQSSLICNLANNLSAKIQTGGGIRSEVQIKHLLDSGVERVIVGSVAVNQPEHVYNWLETYGSDRIVLAVDCKIDPDGQAYVMVHGWQEKSIITLDEMIRNYEDVGLKHVLCTDIERDGTLEGPNLEWYKKLLEQYPFIEFQASGGVRDIDDIKQLNEINMPGIIIGKALYEKRLTLKEALEIC